MDSSQFYNQKAIHSIKNYKKLKIKRVETVQDVLFLQNCLRNSITPNFIKVRPAVKNTNSLRASKNAEEIWLKLEIKSKFEKLDDLNCSLYNLYQDISLMVSNNPRYWFNELQRIEEVCCHKKY